MKEKILVIVVAIALLWCTFPTQVSKAQLIGDINNDGKVDILDLTLATSQYLLTPEDPGYNQTIVERADVAEPYQIIDILDIVTIAAHYTG